MTEKLDAIKDALEDAGKLPEQAQEVIIAYAKGLSAGMKVAAHNEKAEIREEK